MKRRDFIAQTSLGLGLALLKPDRSWSQSPTPTSTSIDPLLLHGINRLSFGLTPSDYSRISDQGLDRYIETQLNPSTLPLPTALENQLSRFTTLTPSAGERLTRYRTPVTPEQRAANQQELNTLGRSIVQEATRARLLRAIVSPRQLEEVLTDFWFNHFNIFSGKGQTRLWVGSYEREAIRPHVFGKFRDMLGATAQHPAMLFYLDNWQSSKQGLNENYARELMELHTLGVDGGYTQSDVQDLAKILTGWTLASYANPTPSGFFFNPNRHDSSITQFLGQTLTQKGVAQGEAALDILAQHPATAKFISFKLAQYFVADRPPQTLIKRLQKRFLDTDGDLREVLRSLFSSAEFRDPKVYRRKYKTPYQYAIAAVRAADVSVENFAPLENLLLQLSMSVYGCPTPDGYKQVESAWLNPDSMVRRLNFAVNLGNGRSGLTTTVQPIATQTLETTIAIQLKPQTLKQIQAQPKNLRSGLMLGSPESMYR
jgi:uncharacterized protein (DUF1800 family)